MTVIVRFAPSPTGHLHLGGARTALFNWLFARQISLFASSGDLAEEGMKGSKVLLRLEDTDPIRSREEFAQAIPEALSWLGLNWDGPIIRQSDRYSFYTRYLEKLESSGLAYRCYCPTAQLDKAREMARAAGRRYRYPGTCRGLRHPPAAESPFVLRIKAPEAESRPVFDRIIGRIPVSGADMDDFVLTRSDGTPLYNFCCVVDDALLGVTHVIRGADHVENTRKQALLYDALGFERPDFAHLPLVAGLSKRLGSTSILSLRDQGFLPEAVINYVARLGWSHGDQEIFTQEELLADFRLADVGHSPARINADKLLWINEKHLRRARPERLAELVVRWLPAIKNVNEETITEAVRIYRSRCKTLIELTEVIIPCLIEDEAVYLEPAEVAELLDPEMRCYLVNLANLVERVEPFDRPTLKQSMWEQLNVRGLGFRAVAPACRLALIGGSAGPRLLDLMLVLGKDKVVKRLRLAAEL